MNATDACCPEARLALATGEVGAKLETLPAHLQPAFRRRLVVALAWMPLLAALPGAALGASVAGGAGALGTGLGFAIAAATGGLIRWYERAERIVPPALGIRPASLRCAFLAAGLGVLGAIAGLAFGGLDAFESGFASFVGALLGVLAGTFVDQTLDVIAGQ